MKLETGTWITYGSEIREAEQTPEDWTAGTKGTMEAIFQSVLDAGMISNKEVDEATAIRNLRHSRTTIASREVFRMAGGEFKHQQRQYWDRRPHDIMMWETVHILRGFERGTLRAWWWAREITITILTLTLIYHMGRAALRVVTCIQLVRKGANYQLVAQPFNPLTSYNRYMLRLARAKAIEEPVTIHATESEPENAVQLTTADA